MVKDLIIGSVFGYSWGQIQYWINSIKKTNFTGDIMLVGTDLKRETLEKIVNNNVFIKCYGSQNENGDIVATTSGIAPHVERFFYIWDAMRELDSNEYRYVICTDVRDVIFQKNPFDDVDKKLAMFYSLMAVSEGMTYENEPWGNKNYLDCFGSCFHELIKKKTICNVGVFGGLFSDVENMALMIFQLGIYRPIKVVDQAVYNFLLHMTGKVDCYVSTNEDAWAVQLGTTEEAVKAGAGDLGAIYKNNMKEYYSRYEDSQPIIENGIVYNSKKEMFSIVHQYDRIPFLKQEIHNLYGDPDYVDVESNGPGIFSYKTG